MHGETVKGVNSLYLIT